MADAIFVAVICAFFALCVVYIRWCDRIIGSDELAAPAVEVSSSDSDTDVATPTSVGSAATA
jgi:hypothetical protein